MNSMNLPGLTCLRDGNGSPRPLGHASLVLVLLRVHVGVCVCTWEHVRVFKQELYRKWEFYTKDSVLSSLEDGRIHRSLGGKLCAL